MNSTSDNSCNNKESGTSKSKSDDGVCDVNDRLNNMSTADNGDVSVCANCGKESDDVNNICNKCKLVKYCNAACKKKHRSKHKKQCEEHLRLAAEHAAELHDEELFKQPPLLHEDCPICFLRMPTLASGRRYYNCCGKVLCSGCVYAPVYDNQGNKVDNKKCPYCRTPWPSSDKEIVRRYKNRMKAGDANAMFNLGTYYGDGLYGLPQDHTKAFELRHRAGELGFAAANTQIGFSYENGRGVEIDRKKANHYYELAAMTGEVGARYSLGGMEFREGNIDRALKHLMIGV